MPPDEDRLPSLWEVATESGAGWPVLYGPDEDHSEDPAPEFRIPETDEDEWAMIEPPDISSGGGPPF